MASEATAFIKKVSSAGGDYCGIPGIEEGATDDEIKKAYRKMALLLHPDKCQENGADEAFKKVGEAYSKLLDGQSSGPTLKPTPKMSQKLRKQARSEMAKQRYGQNPGPNAHNEKLVPKEVPKEWLFEVNAPDIGNVSTTNDEDFEERDDGRVLSGECMKNRHAEGEAYSKLLDGQSSGPTLKPTPKMSQKLRKQARSEMAKQRYGQNPGPNAHNEKPVPKEVPKEWLFEVNAPDIGNVSTTNDEDFEERDDGRVLSGECMKNRHAEGEAYSKLLDGQSSGPTLKPTPKMSQKLRKQARSEMAKQRYGQNPGPNAHNEKPVPKEVPKEWLFEVNAPDIGNVSTTNDEDFEERDDGRVLSGECMKNRHAEGEAYSKLLDGQSSGPTLKPTPKQRYGQNPGPNAHNEKLVPKEVPKEWLFEVNAPDIGNVSTTNDEDFEERDDGRVLSGECMKNRHAEGEAYSKLLDGQSSGPTLKPTPKMSQKLRKQARSEMAKQRYGQNPGPNAHNEKPVPKEVPKEWLFEVNAPDIGNVSTTNDEDFEERDDGRVLSGECMKNRHAEGEAYSKLLDGQSSGPTLKPTPKQRYGQNPGPNAHNEKLVPKEVPKEWLFEVNAPDIGNVSTTNDEDFEERDDGRVLSGECMKNRHAEGEGSTDKAPGQGSNGTTAATSNGSQAQQADREFEGLGDTGGFGGFGIAGMLHEWLQMPNLSLTFEGCCISRSKWRAFHVLIWWFVRATANSPHAAWVRPKLGPSSGEKERIFGGKAIERPPSNSSSSYESHFHWY